MNSSNSLSVKQLNDSDIPDSSGVYVVKIKDIDKLPLTFSKVLKERKHKIFVYWDFYELVKEKAVGK